MRWHVVVLAVAVAVTGAAVSGCTDLSPIEKDLKDIHNQLGQVSTDVGAMKTSLDSASEASRQAQEASENASRTANQALSMAQSDQKSIDAMNEKLEKAIRERHSK
jgi:uncharacterized protein (DUF3084 family)